MIRNYFKTALRNLFRYKGFTLINILGLSIAITGCLVIGLFVRDERQYDTFIKGGENIYRFYTRRIDVSPVTSTANTPPMFATHIQQYPEVEHATRIMMTDNRRLIEANGKKAYEDKGLVVDSVFFNVFPLHLIKGDPATAMQGPSSVVLTEETAKKYFGTIDPMGKTIRINTADFIVTGILAKVPEHFHLELNYLMPFAATGIDAERMRSWQWQQFFTYVKVKPGTSIQLLQTKFQDAVKKDVEPITRKTGFAYVPFLQPLRDIHLRSSEFVYDIAKRGNASYVKGLTIIAIFVLLIACFNFINLATARSLRRAKEIGVRKVAGALRGQLVLQFTGETILLAFISIIVAAITTALVLPYLNNFTGKSISFNPVHQPVLTAILFFAALLIGILAGVYPALVLSGFHPIRVLKGLKPGGDSKGSAVTLRHGLVVVQFALSALLIVCTVIVYRQMNFLREKDLGFNKDQVIYFNAMGKIGEEPAAFKTELLQSPDIVSATIGYGLPGDLFAGDAIKLVTKDGEKEETTNLFVADYDYIKTLGMKVIAGREFLTDHPTDAENAFIINETAVKEFGFETPEKAIGKKLAWDKWIPDSLNPVKRGEVIGVIKDFHSKSLHEKISKTVLIIYPPIVGKVAVKVKAANISKAVQDIRTVWNKFSPDFPLDYNFLDENFEKMYKSEEKLSRLLWIFTAMAIFIGCMGLFGLAAFSAEQRVKEIGIRKVLGASVSNIVTLLSGNFVKLIILSLLIAGPVAWWVMNKWLEDFAYRISIGWLVFVIAGASAIIIAMITVSFHAIRAAVANPVAALRSE